MPRYFTVAQAERVLPDVERALRDALFHKSEAVKAHRELEGHLERIRTLGGVRVNPAGIMALRARVETSSAALKDALDQVEQLGALVKDLDIGLIDFLARSQGREVYLCWKLGEPKIGFWHGLEDGFRGRKKIDQEFLDGLTGGGAAPLN